MDFGGLPKTGFARHHRTPAHQDLAPTWMTSLANFLHPLIPYAAPLFLESRTAPGMGLMKRTSCCTARARLSTWDVAGMSMLLKLCAAGYRNAILLCSWTTGLSS